MKVAIINDQHLGCRGDSELVAKHHKRFYENVFFPTLESRGIDTILDLGDTFHRRKFINYNMLKFWKEAYFDQIQDRGWNLHMIVGNHTVYYNNTNSVNSISLILGEYDNISVYADEPVELQFGAGSKILMVPWLNRENSKKSLDIMAASDAQICMGHFAINGMPMSPGRLCEGGMEQSIFDKFSIVYSGHFHHPSEYNQIKYLGAPYEMDWGDCGGKRGFHIFDTETLELEFIDNPHKVFYNVNYDGSDLTIESLDKLDLEVLEDTYVKILVKDKGDPYVFDKFIDKLTNARIADVKIIEESPMAHLSTEDIVTEAEDTLTIMHKSVDGLKTNVRKDSVKEVLNELYHEAINL